jgi:PAS domain-containing protein
VLLVCLTAVFYLLQKSRDLPSLLVANRVLLFVLFYINVVLILAVLFVLARSIFKLLLERRARILGAKFRSKLVATYVGLSLVPVLVMFVYANVLLQQSVERWFAAPVESVLSRARRWRRTCCASTEQATLHDARDSSPASWAGLELDRPTAAQPALDRRLQPALVREDLDFLGIYRRPDFVTAWWIRTAGHRRPTPEPHRSMPASRAAVGGRRRRRPIPPPSAARGSSRAGGGAHPPTACRPGGRAGWPGRLPVAGGGSTRLASSSTPTSQYHASSRLQKPELAHEPGADLPDGDAASCCSPRPGWASTWRGRSRRPIEALAEGHAADQRRRLVPSRRGARRRRARGAGVLVQRDDRPSCQRSRLLLEERHRRSCQAANRRLDEERGLLVAVLQSVAAGVIASTATERVFLCNDAALAMLRQSEAEVREPADPRGVGRRRAEKLLPAARTAATATTREPRAAGVPAEPDQVRLVLGGEWKTFEVKRAALREPDGSPLGQVLVLEDLTELIKAQQLAAWNEAARRIAHEIKNPLHSHPARRRARAAQAPAGPGGRARRSRTASASSCARWRRSRRWSTSSRASPACRAAAGRRRPREHGAGDGEALSQRQARRRGGGRGRPRGGARLGRPRAAAAAPSSTCSTTPSRPPTPRPRRRAHGAHRRPRPARRRRHRPRHPAEAKEKLFQPHFSTKGRGTGLGLAIVHRVVADHHGTIRVEDNPPRGTVFTIELPRALKRAGVTPARARRWSPLLEDGLFGRTVACCDQHRAPERSGGEHVARKESSQERPARVA